MFYNLKVYKEKQYLIFDFEDGRTVRYDLATNTSIGISGKRVAGLQNQLRGIGMSDILKCFDDQKYASFLSFVWKSRPVGTTNIGTVLASVKRYSRYEQIFSAGIDDVIAYLPSFHYKISEIPKPLIKVARTHGFKITNKLVRYYNENPDSFLVAFEQEFMTLDEYDIVGIYTEEKSYWDSQLRERRYSSYFHGLIEKFGYNAKALWKYFDRLKTFEAIEKVEDGIGELYDYANMMSQISPKYDKYPRNFLTSHQIASRNYSRIKKEFPEDLFRKRIDTKYECKFGNYVFIYPKSTQDIKDEAVQQTNCVASYIDRVIDGRCHILFLRKANKPDKSLVTIEVVDDHIVQARRRFNDPVTKEDQVAIDAFNKKFAVENAA